ncbi:hypothetical protein SAMN03097699_0766 [Flavobacteriaceae bacterium MAR_2010_188]|nr:hypothetical protein SAMN03097699_0766 [Flavobacteriaceae bacterium MAR_2010_188]
MKYSQFFFRNLSEGNLKTVDEHQMKRIFQILSIEGSLQALIHQKDKIPDGSLKKHYYDLEIMSYKAELSALSDNLENSELLKEMINLSKENSFS